MTTKKVKLKNITTEVPKDAVLLTDPMNQLQEGDFCLEIWDNPKSACNMEINNRLFTQIKSIDKEKGHASHGGHWTEAKEYNATTCTWGSAYPSRDMDAKYPHIWFFIRHGTIAIWPDPPNLFKNPGYDLVNL